MREKRNPADAKLTKGKKIKEVENAPGNERAPTVPVPSVPRTEEERARAATLAMTVEAMVDPVIVLDIEGRYVFTNRAYAQMFGINPEDLVGKSVMETPGMEKQKPEEVEKFVPLIREAIERGSAGPVEIGLVAMDGREIPLSVAGGVIKDAQGNPLYLTAVLRDITEQKKAEDRLRASENKYRTLLENLPQKIFLKDRGSVYISCNENFARDRKVKPEELAGKTDYDFFPKELAERYRADDKRVVESGETIDVEEGYIQEGQELIVHTVKTPVKDEQGNIIGLLGIFWDITELKRAEEKLRESEERYRTLFESTADGILVADIQTRKFKFANPAACRILGYSEEELMRMGVDNIHPKYALEQIISEFNAQARVEKILAPNIPCLRKDGTIVYADINTTKALFDGRECNIGFFRDITERKRAEEKLRKLSSVVDAMVDGVTTTDLRGKITYANRAVTEQLGYEKEELIGKLPTEFVAEKDIPKFTAEAKKVLFGKTLPKSSEYLAKRKDGTEIPMSVNFSILHDPEGRPRRIIAVTRDITERKRAEERIEHLNAVLRAISDVSQIIVREDDRDKLLQAICDNLVGTRGYFNTWIALLNESGELVTTAEAGLGKKFLPMVERLKRGELIDCDRKALRQSDVVVTEDPVSTCTDCPLSTNYGGRGAMTVRLKHGEKVYGMISASVPRDLARDKKEQALFKEVVVDIAFALHNIELEEQRNRVEETLRQSEQRYMQLFEGIGDAVIVYGLQGRFLDCNKATLQRLGYSREEFLRLGAADIAHPDFHLKMKNDLKRVWAGETTVVESAHRCKDGRTIPVEAHASRIEYMGKPAILAVVRDITELKKAEEEKLKTAANKQRMEELEKFAKIAVGRELKMVELKNQIKALELRLEGITEKG